MRVAIYARMSTDKQSDASTEDQIARCLEYAARQGWQVFESLIATEEGISGASRHNRPGLLGLMERIDEWDMLVAYDFARLARNQEDLGWIRNRLRVRRKQAIEASTGLDLDNVGSRVMGVMSEEYLEKVSQDTHRGLRGRFDRKLATGGCPFGYRTVPIVTGQDAHGRPITDGFHLEVDPERAAIVVRLFEGYAHQGLGLRALAHTLNEEGAPSARGNGWAPTAIREMLTNPIYRGERVWNRSYWVKDHETGRRRRFERPESDWVRQQDEGWRIVPDDLWEAAQSARARRNERHLRDPRGRIRRTALGNGARRKRLLSGFLECAECGGSFHALSREAWGCSWHRNRGTCANGTKLAQVDLEAAVLRAVREAIDEEVAEHALSVALAELQRRIDAVEPLKLERQLRELDAKIERALDLAIELGEMDAAKERLRELRSERDRVADEYANARTSLPTIEQLLPAVRAHLQDIESTLRTDTPGARLALGALLGDERLRIHADGRIEGTATLAPELFAAPGKAQGRRDSVVAGAGFEPATCGL